MRGQEAVITVATILDTPEGRGRYVGRVWRSVKGQIDEPRFLVQLLRTDSLTGLPAVYSFTHDEVRVAGMRK